ncbi:LuxR C-terminal-related transcriptional regulator [Bosea sp. BK604]|uniref:response regulator transcription factor n=1 Tax=Bosea sp. BK604 TaxID=2512180 RepID=UPI0010F32EA5|nr:LuxR C-terminal-related transcriptional regulator [Bosea sp. BK604]TCR63020.1 FixJ family two-component response regulator [Bosea sp. BK604]
MELVAHPHHLIANPTRRDLKPGSQPRVIVVDHDERRWTNLGQALELLGASLELSPRLPDHFAYGRPETPICLIVQITPGGAGLQFLRDLNAAGSYAPVIFVAESADVAVSVEAMKSGAVDFLCRPYHDDDLLAAVEIGFARDQAWCEKRRSLNDLTRHYETLSERERQVMEHVVKGKMNKQVAFALGISEITVKAHRGKLMRKMKARSLPDLTRMADAIAQGWLHFGERSLAAFLAPAGQLGR